MFNLDMTVDRADRIALRHEARTFQSLDEVVEFLLEARPVSPGRSRSLSHEPASP